MLPHTLSSSYSRISICWHFKNLIKIGLDAPVTNITVFHLKVGTICCQYLGSRLFIQKLGPVQRKPPRSKLNTGRWNWKCWTQLSWWKKGIFEGLLAGLNLLGNKMLIQIAWLVLVQTAQFYHIMIFPKIWPFCNQRISEISFHFRDIAIWIFVMRSRSSRNWGF